MKLQPGSKTTQRTTLVESRVRAYYPTFALAEGTSKYGVSNQATQERQRFICSNAEPTPTGHRDGNVKSSLCFGFGWAGLHGLPLQNSVKRSRVPAHV